MNTKRLLPAILILSLFCFFAHSYDHRLTSQSRGAAIPAQVSQVPQFSEEKAFLYSLAIAGTPPAKAVEQYASYFDAVNYSRAMADEFERNRYLTQMTSTLADRVSKVDFREQFTFEGPATLGEYSFETHAFPLVTLPNGQFYITVPAAAHNRVGGSYDLLASHYFRAQDAVNKNEFNWSIPMPEAEASAFVKERTTNQPGNINRRVTAKITYSIMSWMIKVNATPISSAFAPYIHLVEIYGDESRQRKLAVITAKSGTPLTAFLSETRRAAQSPTTIVGKYPYTADCRDYGCRNRVVGTITLTDVGIELSGEQKDGSVNPTTRRFLDAFAVNREGTTQLWRAESVDSYNYRYLSVVWRPFETFSHEAKLNFPISRERDRFWADLTTALQAWASKYPQFVFVKLNIEQRCESTGYGFGPCKEYGSSEGDASAVAKDTVTVNPDKEVSKKSAYPISSGSRVMTKFGIRNETFRTIEVFLDGSDTPIVVKVNYQDQLEVG
jgi:hypothetical protein